MKYYKAIIRVVKSIAALNGGFDSLDVLREPLIEANDKNEVKDFLKTKYPQFFQNGKIYEKETSKDIAQFFYVVIFELYNHEINLINEGQWSCEYCKQVYENKYIHRPLISRKYADKVFCSNSYKSGNDEIIESLSCYERWKKEVAFKDVDLPDDLNYINTDSLNYIYKITEKNTNKCYVGKTRNAPFFRWWNHLKHSNSPFGLYLQKSKLSDWSFEVLEELPSNIEDKEVFRIESNYINKFDSIKNGFNTVISNKNVVNGNINQIELNLINNIDEE